MNRRARSLHRSGKTRSETFYRYLKPGALAQIRNSRMTARFSRVNSVSQIYSSRASLSPPSAPLDSGLLQANMIDGSPCFVGRVFGPLCPQRKKLLAAKSMWFLSPSPTNLPSDSLPDPTMDVLGGDIVAAH